MNEVTNQNGVDYMQDGAGSLVPVANIKQIDLDRNELVLEIADGWLKHRKKLVDFKKMVLGEVHAFIELAAENHQIKIGGKKGNASLFSFDGRYKLQISIANTLAFNEQLSIAKEIIDGLITYWCKGTNTNLITLINTAFEVDQDGKISTAKILGLLRLKMNDDTGKWREAMTLIKDSIAVVASKEYVRLYERNSSGKYENVALDIAS